MRFKFKIGDILMYGEDKSPIYLVLGLGKSVYVNNEKNDTYDIQGLKGNNRRFLMVPKLHMEEYYICLN